jgi:xylan 1,4-beta-xylosidase
MNSTSALMAVCAFVSIAIGAAQVRAEDATLREIAVDATVAVGTLRPLSGITAAEVDSSAYYRAARINLIRISDAARIFSDFAADAGDPKNYDFAPTDRLVALAKSGADVLLQLGRNVSGADEAPADLDKFAQVAEHIVRHYNLGWDKGFHSAVRYWEIWNEPDSLVSWSSSPQRYYSLYEKTAQAVIAADSSALVGGPSIATPLDEGPYRDGFLDYVRQHRVPLNFFSWHLSSADLHSPYDFVSAARSLRIVLDKRGFGSARSLVDAWTRDAQSQGVIPKAARAAFAASALIYMLGGPIDAQTYDGGAVALRALNDLPDAVGHALIAFGLLKATPVLLRTSGSDEKGFAVVAGKTADGKTVQILISNYQTASSGYSATITMPTARKYQVKNYRITDAQNFILADQSTQSGPTLHLKAELPSPGVEFIVIN